MAGRGGGAYINGRYVSNAGKGKGKSGGSSRAPGEGGRSTGWGNADDERRFERKPGDEEITLERKFDIDILQPGETKTGYLFNMKVAFHYDEGGRKLAGLILYFLMRDQATFRATFLYRPYFFVQISGREQLQNMRDILQTRFAAEGVIAEIVDKEDLALEDHIMGRPRKLIKLSFENNDGLRKATKDLQVEMKRQKKTEGSIFDASQSAMNSIENIYEFDVPYMCRVCIDKGINCGKWFKITRSMMGAAIDNPWDNQCKIEALEMTARPGLRIFAWDIECTKLPLKFPDSAYDRITLISAMVDGSGFLIVNRAEVSQDIEPLEYTPKPEYEGIFETFNEPDEAALLRRFFALIRETNPHVTVTFNGDFFDMPFVMNRAKAYNMDMQEEIGVAKSDEGDFYAGKWLVHLDCFCWVQRDSYLPCGARGLKAVTKYKLKYDPVELDPEDMTPFAKDRPQELAAYSVSDAVATYYLYQKYIHDFIFALCSIIPYPPDDVLRKGSGTLCESLLMNEAYAANVVFPNKHVDELISFHEETNRMIETSTYEGARVECMRVGVFRADIKETFQLEPSAFQVLLNDLKPTVDFFLKVEEKVKLEDVENYDEVLAEVEKQLRDLCDPSKVADQIRRRVAASESPSKKTDEENLYCLKPIEYWFVEGKGGVKSGGKKVKRVTERVIKEDYPQIYHLDVGAMYPNIILSNRLQPSAIVSKEFCAACTYNDPVNNCKRPMDWKWRGDLYMATRADVKSIINEMEQPSRRYNKKDKEGAMQRVKWSDLGEKEQAAEITKAVRVFSQKAYSRLKSSIYEDKTDVVCQRENPFYVDTVLNFRDRRYVFKRKTKEWTKAFEKAEETGDMVKRQEAKDNMLLYDSLQLAHKCILNSFYGYVMRKGARWHSMKMAGIVTYTGSNLIREAREFCEMVGLPIELDTDGIWCMLPQSFPENFKFKMKGGKEIKMPYSNCVLNYRVHEKYTNHQYQDRNKVTGEWETRSENSIFFEIDGPYKCMVLPASTEEDKMLKKRYAVYNFDGSLAELKGFEIKRRGELKLIQVFQEEVFPAFLRGTTKQEVWDTVGALANRWMDVIESKGKTMTDDEVLYFFSENKSMSKSVEASGNYKSVQITCARRLAELLGVDSLLKDAGVSCHMLISSKPHNASTTDRAIPVKIFNADYEVKKRYLRQWCEDSSLNDFDMRSIIDWDYYKDRFMAVILKIITIPANFQKFKNPCPRVPVPLWLKKRLAEQNDRFQQRSLALYLKKSTPGENDGDQGKRKLCDLEDLVKGGSGGGASKDKTSPDLPLVEFGKGPKKWLETQRLRWADGQVSTTTKTGATRSSLFSEGASWAQLSPDTFNSTWHVVSVETAPAARNASSIRVGDSVLVQVDADYDMDPLLPSETNAEGNMKKGTVIGLVGGLARVDLEDGGERFFQRSELTPAREDGLYVLWVLTEPGLSLHRFEVLMKRKVILALESDFNPAEARRPVRPSDLAKDLRVWPREPNENCEGPGVVKTAAPDVGLCNVTWANGHTEVKFSDELERECGGVSKVMKDAPRNLKHACLIEVEFGEDDFQQKRSEGALGDGDAFFPRIEAVYEGEQPLDFDLVCRLGAMVKTQSRLANPRLRLDPDDLTSVTGNDLQYLPGATPARNIYLFLCFDRASSSRSFCGIYAPAISETCAYFGGIDPVEGEAMRPGLEHHLSEQLSAFAAREGNESSNGLSQLPSAVRADVTFATGRTSAAKLAHWADQKLQELKRADGGSICVLCSDMTPAQLQGRAPNFWVDQRHLRQLATLCDTPMCKTPFHEADAHFPALDWPRWIAGRFVHRVPHLFLWWQNRLSLCRAVSIPICNAPEVPAAAVPVSLDVLFSRQLQRDSQLRWASPSCKPDLGEASLVLIDAQEESLQVVDSLLDKQFASGRGGGEVNHPGVYRSVCLEVSLRQKLCICALQFARHLSAMEGGELSRKLIKKVQGQGDGLRNLDHTSEASLTNLESLVNMVQTIVEKRDTKAKEIAVLKQRWAAQSDGAAADISPHDDEGFVQAMKEAGIENAVLSARLEELRQEHYAQESLLDGLYNWLASPTSLFYDRALLRKVHQYMDRVLQLFMNALKRNGCEIIYASYTKVLFATGKLRVIPEVGNFWDTFCENVKAEKVFAPLDLVDFSCIDELFYGVIWLDTANWAAVPIDNETGAIVWNARSHWKIAEFLPPAVRQSLMLYVGELLLLPQQELERRYMKSTFSAAEELPEGNEAVGNVAPMDVDEVEGDCERAAGGVDDGDGGDGGDGAEPKQAGEEDVAMEAPGEGTGTGDPTARAGQVLEELIEYIQGDFFNELRLHVLQCVQNLQTQQAHEAATKETMPRYIEPDDRDSGSSEDENEDNPTARQRRAERHRRHMHMKWSFPEIPGRRQPPGHVEVEFMRAMIQIFQLETCLTDQVAALRERLCQKMKISSFSSAVSFENPCFPLVLRDVICPKCCTASHLDVTSHPTRGPGLWICTKCESLYEKDAVEAQLVGLLSSVVQAWQAQDIVCTKCKRLRTTKAKQFCDCFGQFKLRYDADDFRLIFRMLRSLVVPHDLQWLGQMLNVYESAL